jgi:hypothetical protein
MNLVSTQDNEPNPNNTEGDGLTSIQHFGTILILVRLYGNGTIQRITLTLTLLIHLKRYSKVVVELHLRIKFGT